MRKYRTTETFIEDAEKIHGEKYTYENTIFVKTKEKVKINCVKHGEFETQPSNFLSGKGCMACAVELRANIRRDTLEDFIKKSEETHGKLYDYSQVIYVRETDPVVVSCHEHGPFTVLPELHKKVQGCPVCAKISRVKKLSDSTKSFVTKALAVHGNLYDYSEVDYKGTKEYVKIGCLKHGIFEQWPNNHILGHGCPVCQPGGFNSKISGYVYVLQAENITKVGITNKLPKQRCRRVSNFSKKNFSVIKSYYLCGVKARELEKQVLSWLAENYKRQEDKFNGSTECFLDVDLTALIFKIEQLK